MSTSVFEIVATRCKDLKEAKRKKSKKKKKHKDSDHQEPAAENGDDGILHDDVFAEEDGITASCRKPTAEDVSETQSQTVGGSVVKYAQSGSLVNQPEGDSSSSVCGKEDQTLEEPHPPTNGVNGEHSDGARDNGENAASDHADDSACDDVHEENSVGPVDQYNEKVEKTKEILRSSKIFINQEIKVAERKVVRSGFWDKLRFAMSQPIDDEQAVTECRKMFREEMVRLRREVEEFQELCLKQIKSQKECVDEHRRSCEKEISSLASRNGISRRLSVVREESTLKEDLREELQEMESSMEFFHHKQKILDEEMDLLNKEEEMAKKHKELEEYEREIQEVESLLNQRQAICDRRQKHLLVLDEELHSLRQELEESKEMAQQESASSSAESSSEKAKRNWDIVRRNLMDKQHLLEGTVQKYRSELASASSNIAGKEILISKLQQQLTETENMLIMSEKKLKQLESKLAFSVTESRILEEQLHGVNRKNSLNLSPEDMGRRASFFHRQTSSEGSRSGPPKSPMLMVNDLQLDDSKQHNGSLPMRPSSWSSQGSTVIRRRSMRSNSVAGDSLSRLALRDQTDSAGNGSGACAVM